MTRKNSNIFFIRTWEMIRKWEIGIDIQSVDIADLPGSERYDQKNSLSATRRISAGFFFFVNHLSDKSDSGIPDLNGAAYVPFNVHQHNVHVLFPGSTCCKKDCE
jgi:hypothetical protein